MLGALAGFLNEAMVSAEKLCATRNQAVFYTILTHITLTHK